MPDQLSICDVQIFATSRGMHIVFDDVESYFGSPREPLKCKVAAFWKRCMDVYLKIAVSARDLLSVCSSLVCSESWIFVGRKLFTDTRHSLGEKNGTSAYMFENVDGKPR